MYCERKVEGCRCWKFSSHVLARSPLCATAACQLRECSTSAILPATNSHINFSTNIQPPLYCDFGCFNHHKSPDTRDVHQLRSSSLPTPPTPPRLSPSADIKMDVQLYVYDLSQVSEDMQHLMGRIY